MTGPVPGGAGAVPPLLYLPERFGARANSPTFDSGPALQKALDNQTVLILPKQNVYYTNQQLTWRAGSSILGERYFRDLLGVYGGTIAAGPGLTTGNIIQTEPGPFAGCALSGFNVVGPAAMTTLLGGIQITDGVNNAKISDMTVKGVSGSPIGMSGHPVACRIVNNVVSMDDTRLVQTGPVGALHLTGTDHYIHDNEIARGPSDSSGLSGYKKVTYPGFWRTAIYVGCATSWIDTTVGEFGDCAYYIDTAGGFNVCSGPRADFSAGHGFYVLGSDNQFIGARTLGVGLYSQYAGPATTYDGVNHQPGAMRNQWTNYTFSPVTGIPVARYGWADFDGSNTLWQYDVSEFDVTGDKVYQ